MVNMFVILIFLIISFAISYIAQLIFNLFKIRIIGLIFSIFFSIALIWSVSNELKSQNYNILFIVLSILYIVSSIIFIRREKQVRKGFLKNKPTDSIPFIKKNLNRSWTFAYLYFYIAAITSFGLSKEGNFSPVAIIILILFAVIDLYILIDIPKDDNEKISKINSIIENKGIITTFDILVIAKSHLKNNSKENDKIKKIEELLEIINYFSDNGKLMQYQLKPINIDEYSEKIKKESFFVFMTPNLKSTISDRLNTFISEKEFVTIDELVEKVKDIIDISIESLKEIALIHMYSRGDWLEIEELYMKETYIDKIIDVINTHYKMFGEYDENKLYEQFSIGKSHIEEIIKYRQFEYKDLSFSLNKNNFQDNENIEPEDIIKNDSEHIEIEQIDINSCTEEKLAEVPSIGIMLAKKAIKQRNNVNGYKDIDEMIDYLQIKPHLINKIKSYLICKPIEQKITGLKQSGRRIEF